MKNGSMFGSIHSFEDETFFDGHPYIYVYTENERLTYEIYEAAKFTDVYIPSGYVISSKDDRDQFLADVREKVSDNKLHVREDMPDWGRRQTYHTFHLCQRRAESSLSGDRGTC